MSQTNNFFNSVKGVMGLFGNTNKARKSEDGETQEPLIPEFESTMSDEDIIRLAALWTSESDVYQKDIKQQQTDNENYWLGKQFNEIQTAGSKKPLVDNLLFEAVETFLPIATRGNPQAIVSADGTKEGDEIAKIVADALQERAEVQGLRMTLKGVARDWLLYLVGSAKVVWDSQENNYDLKKVRPKNLILDPNAIVGFDGTYNGEFLGEKKKKKASKLIKMFPSKASIIKDAAQGMTGTKLNYTEWWTPTDLFFTLGDGVVLGKYKNPHWNYSGIVNVLNTEIGQGQEEMVEGKNHFKTPRIPYLFLTVFNLGKRPHDEASLITQNIANQDLINRRYQQIDRNVEAQNNGIVLSGKAFTKEQASEAAEQLAKGGALWVPDGDVNSAYKRDQAPQLSGDVYKQLIDGRNELRNIFGTSGSNVSALGDEKTVRGKIMVNQMDSTRIGGSVTEALEKFAQGAYNWFVQMMYVYYVEEHSFTKTGVKGGEKMTLKNTDLNLELKVTVKDGSLIPKDPLTKRNEAMDLWSAGAIAPIPFFTALDFPNPYETAKELVMWQMIQKGALPPQMMFPDLEQAPPAPIPNTTPGVSAQEAQGRINPAQPDTVAQDSKELLQAVPIQ